MASAEALSISVAVPGGGEPLRLTWDRRAAESLAADGPDGRGRSPWRLEGEPDWEAAEALRLVSAVFEDGRTLALAALRPRGTAGHDRDSVAHHLEESGERIALTEALLSTEYDADGLPRRIGVELWAEPESQPMRLAADRQGEVEVAGDGVRRELARMSFRLEGASGTGTYELLERA
jgi:hypothetical protein